ncbi:hypothetical protein ZWY2020_022565 [Hordeum vulgare]|nr:hypothetical protein ZWY2020_022565 [Hordeum vulgare]
MANKLASLLILAVLVAAACSGSAARDVPRAPRRVRHHMPDIGGLDHSIPAAASGQFIPGADDTWVPNPGFEVPNPFRPASTESP